ncbi:MAG TPA: DUF4912 domain-containing protein [Pyrinomonadaceae bacterium]|jgi:hypothetical protein
MPLRFPGSSELAVPVLTPLEEQSAEVRDKLAALSIDEPLPETYAGDRIRLLMQSPYRLYLYWSHARDPFETLRRAFGAGGASRYQLAVRLVDTESDEERFYEAPPARSFWFNVRPGRRYRAEVGLYAEGRPFLRLLTSELAETPRVGVSPVSDETPEFQVSAPEFAHVLNEAGYAADALEVMLEAADEATGEDTTRSLARSLTGEEAPVADDGLAEMRALLAALAFGEPLERVKPMLSPALARWVEQLDREHAGALDTARLLQLLRASMALELEYDQRLDTEAEDAMRRAARFLWGGSDVRLPTRAPRVWMPSMNAGLISRLAHWRQV